MRGILARPRRTAHAAVPYYSPEVAYLAFIHNFWLYHGYPGSGFQSARTLSYTDLEMFTHTEADRSGQNPIQRSLK